MNLTDYHAKYFAYDLTKRCPSDSVEKLASAVAGAQVDLNPHQIDAALFAFRSPLSRGAILADEVGLGKTIEAGLVLAQRWAERRRRILVITPANLRKQWHQELTEKFFLPCRILEAKPYNEAIKRGGFRPFERPDEIVICSYQFARAKASDVAQTPWDLVVIDEAHRLRNVYKPTNVIANTLKAALASRQKLLLTATPLQNSLLELFGLVSVVDEHAFGDLKSFREQFLRLDQEQVFDALKARLTPLCHRTLRRQVLAYVPYTERHPLVEEFTPEQSEDRLYDLVSEYLRRPNLQALPSSQRALMTLVLRKLLASSTFAIAGALETLSRRLRKKLAGPEPAPPLEDELREDYEALDETADEWEDDEPTPPLSEADRAALAAEIADLDEFARLAAAIDHNAKGRALLRALEVAFAKARELGAAEKALLFTESRRTQSYLQRVLADSPWRDGIVLFNGSNTDERSKAIYTAWLERHRDTDRATGSRSADMRSALVEYFRDEGKILIATEAGAEGINLQFCSLVVNYDLPWNPQRIEQRIGRCHRYGQKHDVVVVNFLNRRNAADLRVFQLLSEKFQLFEGVFGASDEVLGAIESGVELEKRINDIYQRCRKAEEVKQAFDQLVQTAFSNLATSVKGFSHCFLDARELAQDGEVAARLVFARASAEGIVFTPVTGVTRTADVAAALGHRQHGLALRLTRAELESGVLSAELGAFLVRHRVDPEEIDLILDLGAVDDMVVEGVSALSAAFLAAVRDHARWRTFTISASAFPLSMRIVDRDSYVLVERAEWVGWRDSLHARRREIGRLPMYSDCCIQHPRGVEGFDPRMMPVSASIRYAWQDRWLLIKGESTRRTLPSIQFPTLAAQLVRGVHRARFYGSEHCEGCRLIQASADNEPGLGSAEAWRRLGTIHHITTVAEQIAGLPWP